MLLFEKDKKPGLVTLYKESIRGKIFVNFLLLTMAMSFAFTLLFVQNETTQAKQFLEKEGALLSRLLAHNARLGIFSESTSSLTKTTEGFYRYNKILSVHIFTQEGKVLLQKSTFKKKNLISKTRWNEVVAKLEKSSSSFFDDQKDLLTIWTPVLSHSFHFSNDPLFLDNKTLDATDSRVIGYIRLVLSKKEIQEEIQSILITSALTTATILCVGSFFIFLIATKMTTPLKALAKSMRIFGENGKAFKVPVKTEDEIGRIGIEFNRMIEALNKRENEKNELEKKLMHSQKLAAIGTLTSGIAHNFNNILCSMTLSLNALDMKTDYSNPSKPHIKHIFKSAIKATNLVKNMLNFCKGNQDLPLELINLNEIISMEEKIISDLLTNSNIHLSIELPDHPLLVLANSEQIGQILLNLAGNAKDAISIPDGVISISLDFVELDRNFLKNQAPCREGQYAILSFIDNGFGMDEETMTRIFEPFYTTKDVDKGTGLGLSTVHGMIQQYKGFIHVFSKPNEGTIFKIYIPLAGKAVQ